MKSFFRTLGGLPAGSVDVLMKPESKAALTKVLTYHVVAGRLSANELRKRIRAGGGMATLRTVAGRSLVIVERDGKLWIKEKDGTAAITISDVFQSNGVIHVVDTVLMPSWTRSRRPGASRSPSTCRTSRLPFQAPGGALFFSSCSLSEARWRVLPTSLGTGS